MTETMTVTPETEAEWLAERRNSIGASEAAAVMGVCPYTTPLEKWMEKVGTARPTPSNVAMRVGKALEPLALEMYEEQTGRAVVDRQLFVRHPDYPYLTATLDGRTEGNRIVEVKSAGAFAKGWEGDEPDAIPDQYLVQLAQQMAVTGAQVADLAVIHGNSRFRVYTDIPRNEGLVEAVVRWGRVFWHHVTSRTPPDWGRLDARALAVLHPGCEGEMTFGEEAATAVESWEQAGEALRKIEAIREESKARVLAAMGDHQVGVLPDGRRVRRYRRETPERTVQVTYKGSVSHYFSVVKERA